jgi:catechol 2,3-dioxygenase-like lactoylglutathione lyase family enzyme
VSVAVHGVGGEPPQLSVAVVLTTPAGIVIGAATATHPGFDDPSVTGMPPAGAAMSAPWLSNSIAIVSVRPCAKVSDVTARLRRAVWSGRARGVHCRAMRFAHLTLPTPHVERTSAFLERTLGLARKPIPPNSPVAAVWLDLGDGQEMHVFHVPGFAISAFESEFGRHVALFHPRAEFPALKARLLAEGAELVDPLRPTPFERFFFREPVNGYLFEVIDADRPPEGS